MGIDIHIHDTYWAVGHVPIWIAALVVSVLVVWGAQKLARLLY
jgi:hypothetical protein